MAVHSLRKAARNAVSLFLAFAIAFALLLLNLAVNFTDEIHRFFQKFSSYPVTGVLANILLCWLVAMLGFAFRMWRRTERDRVEVERVVSAISPDALLVVTPEREILMCNRSVNRIFGYSEHDLIHQKTDLLYGDRRSRSDIPGEIHEALERQGFHIGLAMGMRKDGTTVPIEIISGELSSHEGAVLLLRDISERLRAEDARRKLRERLVRQRKMESVGVLAGGIAHDFNNLLAGMMGNAELALQNLPESDTSSREGLQDILMATQRAARLCKDMLFGAGKGRRQMDPLNLSDLVRGVAHIIEVTISKRHTLVYDLADGLPAVEGDAAQLQQVILNLTLNASEAIGGEGGTITIRTGMRDCDAEFLAKTCADDPPLPGRYVYVQVADTGCGIDAATRSKLFEPFFTTKQSRQGLGLVSVRGIAMGHGGTVMVGTEADQGSTFTVLFPASARMALPRKADGEDQGGAQAGSPMENWKGRGTVLVVEDEATILTFVEQALGMAGLQVVIARDGHEGLQQFRKNVPNIDLTLLDLSMPRMGGEAVLREIRALDPKARVILCSGTDPSALPESLKAENILSKPYQLGALLGMVREALEEVRR